MRWKKTATVMILWSALAALATTFIFSCCVLPFHQQIHAALPLCHVAKAIAPDVGTETEQQNATPAERASGVAKSIPAAKFVVAASITAIDTRSREQGSAVRRAHCTH